MAKKHQPAPEAEEAELIKKIDRMMDPKFEAAEVSLPTSLGDMKLDQGDSDKELPDPVAEPAAKDKAKEPKPRPSSSPMIDDPATERAFHEIEVADSDRLLAVDLPPAASSDHSTDEGTSLSQWLWLIGVIAGLVAAVLYLLLLPANPGH